MTRAAATSPVAAPARRDRSGSNRVTPHLPPTGRIDAEALTSRVAGFVTHLRLNDFGLGPGESAATLELLGDIDGCDPREVRLALKSLLARTQGRMGAVRRSLRGVLGRAGPSAPAACSPGYRLPVAGPRRVRGGATLRRPRRAARNESVPPVRATRTVTRPGEPAAWWRPRRSTLARTDLRHLAGPRGAGGGPSGSRPGSPGPCATGSADATGTRTGRRALTSGRTVRRNLGRGGEPFDLVRRRRRDRPVRIVVLLDVSGSMEQYSRFFLQFVKGLVGSWVESDAYLFHTRLVRITEALRDHEPVRAMSRLTLLAEGFGGGTRIARIPRDIQRPLREDGPQQPLGRDDPLRRLRHRGRLGHVPRDAAAPAPGAAHRLAEPAPRVARLRAGRPARWPPALPFVDRFAPAHTLEALAAVEGELARL